MISSGSAGGEYVRASLSPGGESLFLFSYVGGQSCAFRVDVATGAQAPGPGVNKLLSVTSRVFALDASVALYHFIRDNWKTRVVEEGFARVDFDAGTAERHTFATAPSSDFDSDTRLMAIDPQRRLGIRPDYQPVELVEVEGAQRAVLRVEIFDLDSLETRARPVALRWPVEHLDHPESDLVAAEPGSEELVEAQDWYVRWLCSARFVAGSDHVWVSMQRGIVRRLSLDGGEPSAPILHGGGPTGGGFTLNDVFARNLINNHTLGVSPSGRYVGFGNPNDFFCIDDVDLGAARAIKLPERAASGPVTEAPGRIDFAGDRLLVFDRARRMFIAGGATGAPGQTVELPHLYGDATMAAMSPGGSHIGIAVSGGGALLYDVAAGELMELPVPPHSIYAGFTSSSRLYMVHHAGAVVAIDLDEQRLESFRAPDDNNDDDGDDFGDLEDIDPEELEYMRAMEAFEQRWDCYAGVAWRAGGVDRAAVIDENDALQLYSISGDLAIEAGPAIRVTGRDLAAGDGWIAVASGAEVRVVDLERGEVVQTLHFEGELRALHTGSASGALYVFDDQAGQLVKIGDPRVGEREVVFEYRGASVGQVAVSEELGRAALVTASGAMELRELAGGELVATLRVKPRGGDVRELVSE